ncbi:MAG: HAMP domain-containing sensor histidine kinase [Bdellovibrionia bacterium]
MVFATDKGNFNPRPHTTAGRLRDCREQMLSKFVERVRQGITSAHGEDDSIIVDTLPAFVDNLAEALDPNYPRKLATEGTSAASEHGGERARVTRYSPRELIKEYQILKDTLLEVLSEGTKLSKRDTNIITASVDNAMEASLWAYFMVHQGLREQFVAILTHDLRNPLSAIKASSELILRFPVRTSQTLILAARIIDSAQRIDRMIQDLLDASRVRFGEKLNYEVSKCDLVPLIQDVIAHLATVYGERFVLNGENIQGYWNKEAFKRAIENLLVNAIKYGDPTSSITVLLQKIRGRAIVSVHNEGPPIPKEEQESLFQSFMRAQSTEYRKKNGWGLGLAMVRGMAEGHGGSICVDSAPGRGTTFIIDVPVDSRPHLSKPVTPGT